MSDLERQAVSEQQIAGDESMLDTDFYTPTREGIEAVDIEAVQERVRKQREEEERQRALERSRRSGFTYPNMYGITSVEGVI
jgi:predicted AAA+ superfamily ATPase